MTGLPESTKKLKTALLTLDRVGANQTLSELAAEKKPVDIIDHLIVPVMEQIGDEWESGHLAMTQVYMSGRICED